MRALLAGSSEICKTVLVRILTKSKYGTKLKLVPSETLKVAVPPEPLCDSVHQSALLKENPDGAMIRAVIRYVLPAAETTSHRIPPQALCWHDKFAKVVAPAQFPEHVNPVTENP